MATYRYVVADVFTDTPLTGNQLAVFTDARGLDDGGMQALALEVGFSETVFVFPPEAGGNARIRIFTPDFELPFAGHPTLGTAFVLGAPLQLGVITLETGRGNVPVVLERDESGRIVFGRMEQPVPASAPTPTRRRCALPSALRAPTFRSSSTTTGPRISSSRWRRKRRSSRCSPTMPRSSRFGVTGVSCFAGSGGTWKLRMFWAGGEDAATGSAAGPLACHLARHGRIAWGDEIVISQGAEIGRPSTLYARAEGGDGLIDRVEVGGRAVTVARGEFRL